MARTATRGETRGNGFGGTEWEEVGDRAVDGGRRRETLPKMTFLHERKVSSSAVEDPGS